MRILIIILVLFFTTCACDRNIVHSTLITEKIVNKHQEIQKSVVILERDTLVIDNFTLDYRDCGRFYLDTFSDKHYLWFNDSRYPSDTFSAYFDISELSHIKKQIIDTNSIIWSAEHFDYLGISNKTIANIDSVKNPHLHIWQLLDLEKMDYLTISKPLINKENAKAIAGSGLYISNYYLETLYILSLHENEWKIDNSRTKVLKFTSKKLKKDKESIDFLREYTNGKLTEVEDGMEINFEIYCGTIRL